MTGARRVNALKVFGWLIVLTLVEVGMVYLGLPKRALAAGLVGTALWKATLVALYFMHLKFEGRLIWGMAVGTVVLGLVFVGLLFPDIVVGYWR
jgi:cytochrome c oxidase subunit 4